MPIGGSISPVFGIGFWIRVPDCPKAMLEGPKAATAPSAVRMLDNPGGFDWTFQRATGTGEYYLLENRQRLGSDAFLNGAGLLIWHVDSVTYANGIASNSVNPSFWYSWSGFFCP